MLRLPQPGVQAIVDYLSTAKVKPNCDPGHYYLLNNYNPGYFGDGTNAYAAIANPHNTVFTVPPSRVRNIGDVLAANKDLVRLFRRPVQRLPGEPL